MPGVLMGVGRAGLKESGDPDILVLKLPDRSVSSFLFTKNSFKSASVLYSQDVLKEGKEIRALLINSGNANCGTGEVGYEHAQLMAQACAQNLGIKKEEVLVFSTGVIGEFLPIEKVLAGVEEACSYLDDLNLELASWVISTTDRFPKVEKWSGGNLEVYGFAKGAGMIEPNMGTMLAFVFTNAKVEKGELENLHRRVNEKTFNSITVDGCMSTNDSFALVSLGEIVAEKQTLERGIEEVSLTLAKKIVKDGEGATKVIAVTVLKAKTEKKAKTIAKKVANSLLVKTAVFGRDPNWGRIAAALGSTDYRVDPSTLRIYLGNILLYRGGKIYFSEDRAREYIEKNREIRIVIDLGEGKHMWTCYSSDLGYDYIRINAEYRT